MVFIGGPRQVGKTTLAVGFISGFKAGSPAYLNWDNETDRRTIQKSEWSKDEPLVVFDEIHKKKGWQSFVKGAYDTWKLVQNYIVTGSARLDLYRKGGDSLLGRYHHYRIHPFTLPELGFSKDNLKRLFQFGGFPEPLLEGDETQHRRWINQRVSRLVRQDIRDLEKLTDLDKVELLPDALAERVGSPLSYKSLSEDLSISDKTVKRWVQILEAIYFCYSVAPFGSAKIKSVKKSQKVYLWDWSQVSDPGFRFENMVGSHLLKLCHFWNDVEGYKTELRYIRAESGKECDFVVLKDKKPLFAVECKLNDESLSPQILEFKKKLQIPMWYQVIYEGKSRTVAPDIKILGFEEFCKIEKLI